MSSELFSMDQEAESYLELERESVVKHQRTWVQKAKKALTEAHVIRLPSLPILEWLPKYPVKQQLLSDMNAGLACAVLLIPQVCLLVVGGVVYVPSRGLPLESLSYRYSPWSHSNHPPTHPPYFTQGMAYGIQLGIPVIHGLYGAIFFGLVYVLFGTSKETCPANTALVTMMAASALDAGLPEGYSKPMRLLAAMHFTFFVGVVQIGLVRPSVHPPTYPATHPLNRLQGIFRLGAIVHYVSYPVMVACNSAGIVITVRPNPPTHPPTTPSTHPPPFHRSSANSSIFSGSSSQPKPTPTRPWSTSSCTSEGAIGGNSSLASLGFSSCSA